LRAQPSKNRAISALRLRAGSLGARAGRFLHGRVEEQRQVHAGEEKYDEAVERELAEQERPMGREDLVEPAAESTGRVEPLIADIGRARRSPGPRVGAGK
jgi:hypothetical protein